MNGQTPRLIDGNVLRIKNYWKCDHLQCLLILSRISSHKKNKIQKENIY